MDGLRRVRPDCPADDRQPATKAELALRLLDELRGEDGISPPITGESGYITAPDFRDGLATRGLASRDELPELLAKTLHRFESFDGESVPVFLYEPEDGYPAPVVIWIHGGPEAQLRP